MIRRLARSRGFTLFEVVIAVALLAVVATVVMQSFMGTVRTKEAYDEAMEMSHTAYQILTKIQEDLGSAYLQGMDLLPEEARARREQTDRSREIPDFTAFIGEDQSRQGNDADVITFTTLHRVKMALDSENNNLNDHAEVSYRMDHDDRLDTMVLFRREDPSFDTDPLEGGEEWLIASGMTGFEVRYYDGLENQWRRVWRSMDMTPPHMPLAVHVTLTFETERGNELKFSDLILVPNELNWLLRAEQAQKVPGQR